MRWCDRERRRTCEARAAALRRHLPSRFGRRRADLNLSELIDRYREAITEAVIRTYPPVYDAEARHSSGFDLRCLLRRPLGAQGDAIRATALSLRRHPGTNVVGEMGTGKTMIAAAAPSL